MWDAAAEKTRKQGGKIEMNCRATGLHWDAAAKTWEVQYQDKSKGALGTTQKIKADHVISSAPIRELVGAITPPLKTRSHSDQLRYRDFITVALILKDHNLFQDNWVYIHDPSVKVGRIQNFKSWSPELIPADQRDKMNCYGLEYFCFEGDGLWTSSDQDLIELGKSELEKLGIARREDILDGCVVRQSKAYPVYDDLYATHVDAVRQEIDQSYPNLHLVGRNGMHKYNNQDHAMMTALLTAQNILAGKSLYNVWEVNQDAEYHEAGKAGAETGASGLRMVPTRIAESAASDVQP
jgi:protoporphyrinogen oxidase